MYSQEAYHYRGWTPCIFGVRTLVIRRLKTSSQRGWTIRRPLRSRHSPGSQWAVWHGRLTPISKSEAKIAGYEAILGIILSSLVTPFFPAVNAFLSQNFGFIYNKVDRTFEGTENDDQESFKKSTFLASLWNG